MAYLMTVRLRLFGALIIAVFAALAALSIGGTAYGQEPVRIEIDQVIVADNGDTSLTAIVSVSDKDRRPVPGLTAFETWIDGLQITPSSVASAVDEETGVAVLLLMDASGSMSGEPIAAARNAASIFLRELRPNDSAAVAPFGSEAPRTFRFRSDGADLQSDVAALAVEEKNQGTALYDSISGVLNAAWETPLQRRALILLTDGRESGQSSVAGRDDALAAAAAAGVPVFAIGLGAGADTELLQELANEGRGSFYFAPTPDDIPTIFEAIGISLRSQYVLSIPLPDSGRSERTIVVRLEHPDVVLSAGTTFLTPAFGRTDGGGGIPSWLMPAGAIAVLLAGLVGLFWLRRRRQRSDFYQGGGGGQLGVPLREADRRTEPEAVNGSLTVLEGPNAGAKVALGRGAVDIGTGTDCGLRLDGSDSMVAPTHARVWLKGDRLMVHHVGRRRQTFVGDRAVEWATLEPRETLRIGPHVIGFRVATGVVAGA